MDTLTETQTPFLTLSGTRKVVRTTTNPFETVDTDDMFVPKEIIARRIQDICTGTNKGRKTDHHLVVSGLERIPTTERLYFGDY